MRGVAGWYPREVHAELDVDLLCDNLAGHQTRPSALDSTNPQDSTSTSPPTASSWLNQAERWFGFRTDRPLRRGVHKRVAAQEKTSANGSPTGARTRNPSYGASPPKGARELALSDEDIARRPPKPCLSRATRPFR